MGPTNSTEWAEYIGGLAGEALYSKAMAANSPSFVRMLREEGAEAADITEVLTMFAKRLVEDDQAVPSRVEGSYIDYAMLLYPDPVPSFAHPN